MPLDCPAHPARKTSDMVINLFIPYHDPRWGGRGGGVVGEGGGGDCKVQTPSRIQMVNRT
jgi:hypothetical protein